MIFGFCLSLCDPVDYFRIAAEADRVLSERGWLAIYDFTTPAPIKVPYAHKDGLYSHKMEFSRLFMGNPAYRMFARHYFEHQSVLTFEVSEAISVDILRKTLHEHSDNY